MSEYDASSRILLRPDSFAHDAENRLGRANGNTYQRKPGVPGVHDGQIMVRLKKKRFIVLDYGHVPTSQDLELARAVPYLTIPDGAGRTQCATQDCTMNGVPCCLYDTEPDEPVSLYLRGGLCFTCQKNLNEKRRTQRKPKRERREDSSSKPGSPGTRFKLNGQVLDLNPNAVVINGAVDGTRPHGPDYGCAAIGADLSRIVSELSQETYALMQTAAGNVAGPSVDDLYQRAFLSASRATFLLTQWKASLDETRAANADQAADSMVLQQAMASQHSMHAPLFQPLNQGALNMPLPPQHGSVTRHAEI